MLERGYEICEVEGKGQSSILTRSRHLCSIVGALNDASRRSRRRFGPRGIDCRTKAA